MWSLRLRTRSKSAVGILLYKSDLFYVGLTHEGYGKFLKSKLKLLCKDCFSFPSEYAPEKCIIFSITDTVESYTFYEYFKVKLVWRFSGVFIEKTW